jgi:hypothetical protein
VIEEVRAHLGVEVRRPGNVGNWPYHVQLCFSLDLPGHARLDAALKTVEARLGLKSPEFSPWPLVINVDVTAQQKDYDNCKGRYYLLTSDDLSGFLIWSADLEDVKSKARDIIVTLLCYTYGIDVDAVNTTGSGGFDCLKIQYHNYHIKTVDKVLFSTWLGKLEEIK